MALRDRASVFLRVNLARTDRDGVASVLAQDAIAARPHRMADTALEVTEGARQVARSGAYADGLVELQDVASQAVVADLPLGAGQRLLDYCAGGGGKALAMAARTSGPVWCHDAEPRRMADLPDRAARAGADLRTVATDALPRHAPFDLVLCDSPCSGSGSWRRDPGGKWALTPEGLETLTHTQDDILDRAAALLAAGGLLAYATCSLLKVENEDRIAAFLDRNPDWHCVFQRRYGLNQGGDGFFTAHLARNDGKAA